MTNDEYYDKLMSEQVEKSAEGWRAAARDEGWLPIDSAPRDGTAILVVWAAHDDYAVVWWEAGEWCEASNDNVVADMTHWMPLPAPPAEGG